MQKVVRKILILEKSTLVQYQNICTQISVLSSCYHEARQKATRRMVNILDETEGVSNVDMTENIDIPDHPWPI